MSTAILICSQYLRSFVGMSFCDTEKAYSILFEFYFFFYFCQVLRISWTFQILIYIWHFHVFVSQKFVYY